MQDEAPDGQPQDVAEGQGGEPGSTWWPWPELHADDDAPGHRDGAPGSDETLTLPVDEPAVEVVPVPEPVLPEPVLEEPVIEEAVVAVLDPAPASADPVTASVVAAAGAAIDAAAPPVTSETAMVAVLENPEVPRDYEPPVEGVDKVGSIPAVTASHAWAKGQWSNWRLHLVRFISAGLSVVLAVALVPGLSFTSWRWGEGLEIALIFALLNAFVKPLLQFMALRFLFSSYGIVIVLINTLLLMLLARVLNDSIEFKSLLALLVGGALVGLIGGALDAMLGANYPMLDRDYKERNGLT
jgi:putative membrane protein